jgi:hypothetical protein
MHVCGLEDNFFSTNAFTLRAVVPGVLESSDDEVNK